MRVRFGQSIFEAGDRVRTRLGDAGVVVVPNAQELPAPVVIAKDEGYLLTTLVILDGTLDIRTFLTRDLELID